MRIERSMVRSLTSRVVPVPLTAGAAALLVATLTIVPSLRNQGWDVTALPRVAAGTPLGDAAKRIDPGFRTVRAGGYDGQFYWAVAVDPLATGSVHRDVDKPSYRYGHPLDGWLGWLLSAGQSGAAAGALLAVGLLSFAVAAAAAAWLGMRRGSGGWESLFVIANAGLLYSTAHDLAEPLSVALLLGGIAAYVSGRRAAMLVCFCLLPFAKEPLAIVPLAVAVWELWRNRASLRSVLPFGAILVPGVAWWIYARAQLGAWFTSGDTALGLPFAGWKRAVLDAAARSYSTNGALLQIGEETLVVLAALLGVLAVAGLCALRLRGPIDLIYLPLALLALCLAPNATVILRDALRNAALLVVLVPFVIASPPLLPTWSAHRGARSSRERRRSPT
jgi:hypothetical protein